MALRYRVIEVANLLLVLYTDIPDKVFKEKSNYYEYNYASSAIVATSDATIRKHYDN